MHSYTSLIIPHHYGRDFTKKSREENPFLWCTGFATVHSELNEVKKSKKSKIDMGSEIWNILAYHTPKAYPTCDKKEIRDSWPVLHMGDDLYAQAI